MSEIKLFIIIIIIIIIIYNYNGTISIGGGKSTNLSFADVTNGITGDKDELSKLVQNLDTAATKSRYATISWGKSVFFQ